MAFLEWKSEFSVGIVEFDMQHRQLVAIINRLHDAMLEGAPRDSLRPILRELANYTKQHFEREELAMRTAGYPGYKAHRQEHEKLADQVFLFAEQFENGRVAMSIDLMNFLKNWLVQHILGSDKAYAPHLASGLALSGGRGESTQGTGAGARLPNPANGWATGQLTGVGGGLGPVPPK